MNKITTYLINKLSLIDDIFDDFIGDLKSFRVQLVYFSYLFNFAVLYGVIYKGIDYKALAISFGTQTILYTYYFASKSQQAKIENQKTSQTDPPVDRDPDSDN